MQRFPKWVAAAALAAGCCAAHAGLIDARFSGTVNSQSNTTFAVGSTINGEFVYDTALARYVSFAIGGQSVAAGFASMASITPDLFSAIYEAQLSPLAGGTVNSTFVVDLEAIAKWPSNNAIALLSNASQLATNLDTALSNFGFFSGNADGTNIRSLNATLSRISVTAVPEPETLALVALGLAVAALRRTRRQAV